MIEKSQQSVNGPDAESANRVQKIIEHPDADQLDPEKFRLDQSALDQPVAKTILTAIAIRGRPDPIEFFQVHPDPEYRMGPVSFIALKQSQEYYLVAPELRSELRAREYWIGEIFLAINQFDKPFFWIVKTQSPTGKISDWYTSALECAERAMSDWVQLVSDQSAGVYTVSLAEEKLPNPKWPEQSFRELFRIAFKRRTVDSLEHAVFKQLRGRL